jgi:hypothetical protein
MKKYCYGLPERSATNHQNPELRGWCDECKYFVGCQEANRNPPSILTLPMKKRYYDEILAGTKKQEFRPANDYWLSRIKGKHFDVIEFRSGYPERGDSKRHAWFRFGGVRYTNSSWLNEQEVYAGATIVILIGARLDYPYQVMEK